MRIDQRAWLSVKPNLLAPQVNGMVLAPTTVTNIGKTPAKNIHGWVFIQTLPRNNTIDFSNPTFTEAPRATPGQPLPVSIKFNVGVLIPGEPLTFNEVAMRQQSSAKSPVVPVPWTQTMQEQYDKGDFYLAVRAHFTYDDAAGNPHWTKICRISAAPGQAEVVPNDVSEKCMSWTSIDNNK